ncbi:hypothetical protein RHSIM_Rhsim01G0043900 [Rhododendron simsii]|uniref:DUF4218 domain-containing protein n=1 Tax=Rhododendron simsii TaxID=118357 RepID=A0A834LUB4_RHOSS|nr:hypothetical protein RHSIM_Rhsim01G0043900 [Rhododendron simsii]
MECEFPTGSGSATKTQQQHWGMVGGGREQAVTSMFGTDCNKGYEENVVGEEMRFSRTVDVAWSVCSPRAVAVQPKHNNNTGEWSGAAGNKRSSACSGPTVTRAVRRVWLGRRRGGGLYRESEKETQREEEARATFLTFSRTVDVAWSVSFPRAVAVQPKHNNNTGEWSGAALVTNMFGTDGNKGCEESVEKEIKNESGTMKINKGGKRGQSYLIYHISWEELLVRNNLDVLHIIKNIIESLIGTLLDINGKSKDGLNARKDMQDLEIKHDLHPEDRGSRTYLPPTCHTLSKDEKQIFCKRFFDLKVPDGYSSNIGNCVSMDELKVTGLKSHDCHVLMLQLLPVALKGLLPTGPRNAILRLCAFFNRLCQKVIDQEEMASLEDEVVEMLCMLERFFPPSFFDIMVYLTIHLGREAQLCGLVQYRWMYLFKRMEDGFTFVNLHQGQTQYDKDPFILASQAKQVFYSREIESSNWYVVLKAPPRGFYDLKMYEETVDTSSRTQDVSALGMNNDDDDERITNIRGDCKGTWIEDF